MAQYEKLYSTPKNLYTAGCPLIIEEGALLKEKPGDSLLAQLKLRNISGRKIRLATVTVDMFDSTHKKLDTGAEYQYTDVTSENVRIPLPNKSVRYIMPHFTSVVFADGNIWDASLSAKSALQAALPEAPVEDDSTAGDPSVGISVQAVKKQRKSLRIIAAVCVLAVLAAGAMITAAIPRIKYSKALSAIGSGDYDTGYALLSELGREDEIIQNKRDRAAAMISEENFDDAYDLLNSIGDTCAVEQNMRERAQQYCEDGNYDAAYALWEKLGDAEAIKESKYLRALDCMDEGYLDNALQLLEGLSYENSEEIVAELKSMPAETDTEDHAEIQIGDTISFGSYEQDNNTANGKEDIEWIVLAKEDDQILVVSWYALDVQPYNSEWENTTWDTCTLRTWLNTTFYDDAFSSDEQNCVKTTYVFADSNPQYSTNQGHNTLDHIFLLSANEVAEYFTSSEEWTCEPSAYAAAQGAYVHNNSCWWWLRTSGQYANTAAYVYDVDSIYSDGNGVNQAYLAVRPAMWIDLSNANTLTKLNTVSEKSAAYDSVFLGSYEQDNNTENGKESIEWLVLKKEDGKALIISKYALNAIPYNEQQSYVTWEKSYLRDWLNGTFFDEAFNEEEKAKIQSEWIKADTNPEHLVDPGHDTKDAVFLLSIKDAYEYFNASDIGMCEPTAYAVANGVYVNKENGNCRWWLRSPGSMQDNAAFLGTDGEVRCFGYYVSSNNLAVRPAIWINLE